MKETKSNKEYIYGKNTVKAALMNSGRSCKLFTVKKNDEFINLAKKNKIEYEKSNENLIFFCFSLYKNK